MILHICTAADWANVPVGGRYRASSLDEVGFIHCADRGTVHLPAGERFAGRTDLVLLEIAPEHLNAPVRWEPGDPPHPTGIWFPHIYGPIPYEAVLAVHDFPPETGGGFRLPEDLAEF